MNIATISIKKGGKVLIVEDNKDRLEWFMCKLRHEKVWTTDKPDEAVRLLQEMSPESNETDGQYCDRCWENHVCHQEHDEDCETMVWE